MARVRKVVMGVPPEVLSGAQSAPVCAESECLDRAVGVRGVGNGPVAGRFVLLHRMGTTAEDDAYVTSWDTWAECSAAFPMERGFFLFDEATGREWLPGSAYEWEAART